MMQDGTEPDAHAIPSASASTTQASRSSHTPTDIPISVHGTPALGHSPAQVGPLGGGSVGSGAQRTDTATVNWPSSNRYGTVHAQTGSGSVWQVHVPAEHGELDAQERVPVDVNTVHGLFALVQNPLNVVCWPHGASALGNGHVPEHVGPEHATVISTSLYTW